MTKNFPDYLKLHREEPPALRSQPRDIRGLDDLCDSFVELTGWRLDYMEEPPADVESAWSMSIGASEDDLAQLALTPRDSSARTLPFDSVRPLATAIGELVSEVHAARSVIWQREAELAAGIPVTIRSDQQDLAYRLESVLRGGAEAIGCQAAALYLLDDATSHLKLRACWKLPKSRFLAEPRPLRGAVADLEALVGHAVALEDTSLLPHWRAPEDFPAAICVPVSTASTPLGTLWFFADHVRKFTDEQTHLAEIIAGRLVADLEREVLLMEGLRRRPADLAQQALANWQDEQRPRVPPLVDGWQVAGRTHREGDVGGQFFDWCVLPDGQIAVALGHAEGPPVDASLTAATLQVALRSHATHRHDARQMLEWLNEAIWTHSTGNRFASLFYAAIDPGDGAMRCAPAGETHAMLARHDGFETLTEHYPLLGLDPDVRFRQTSRVVDVGESLVVFSRRIENPVAVEPTCDHEEEARVSEILQSLDKATAEEQVDAVLHGLTAGAPLDRTVVVVRRIF